MNASTAPILRRAVWTISAPFRCYQRRWAQVHDVRFLSQHQTPAKVQDKYRRKLEQKAREQGYEDVEQLREAHSDRIQTMRQEAMAPLGAAAQQHPPPPPPPTPEKINGSIPFQAPPAPEAQIQQQQPQHAAAKKSNGGSGSGSGSGVKTLSSFIDVEKTAELPRREIEAIWRLRHVRDAQSLCAVMDAATYTRIADTARKHPQFILPLPRDGQGAEIHFLQWTFPSPTTATVLFTHLGEFKARGEFAQPHTTVTHHLDLAAETGVVMLEGRVMEDRGVSVDEGRWLLMCLQKFYGFEAAAAAAAHGDVARENAERRRKLMEQFSGGDEAFRVEDLLEEAEKVP